MKVSATRTAIIGLSACLAGVASAAPPSLDDFFSGAQIRSVSISPNGQYLAMIVNLDDRRFVAVKDRTSSAPAAPVLAASGKDSFEPRWCHWANDERIVCSFQGRERDKYVSKVFPVTRLVAVNRDGSKQKQLLEDPFHPSGQLNDRIIDWTPEDPKTVLIEKFNPRVGLRVLKLNVYTGDVDIHENVHEYVGAFGTDGHGTVRLGWGVYDLTAYTYAKLKGELRWRRLSRTNALSTDEAYRPIAVIPGTNYAYALKDHEGRQALWKIDLADKEDPKLVFASSRIDVQPIFTPDNRVLAVLPDSGSKDAFYVEPSAEMLGEVLAKLFKDKQYHIADMSSDLKVVVIESDSDVQPPEYHVLDLSKSQPQLQRVGSRFPGLDKKELAKTRYLNYPARDGTSIPAYLTLPVDAGVALPPLIVLPHGGPWARDSWGFNSWVQMLVRDGYAVLQMNYRGSAGYGTKWRDASYRDWGGLPYTDTIDGLKWALETKIGDPKRVCVVGGSFGGYLALAAATHDSPLLRCVVSVAGVSDLRELKNDSNFFANHRVVHDMIGDDPEKLKAQSPRMLAASIGVPVLLLHGADDWTVEVDQSHLMAKAMDAAGKPYEMVVIPDTDHYFQNPGPQRQLFATMSEFLGKHLANR
ncbi:MAG TPA: alpha/beta fold hydrolase [Steroidobacteraceae bacterium]|nr:alpha/beta fold hydrolase [Steroidobacteraceae bacterium]